MHGLSRVSSGVITTVLSFLLFNQYLFNSVGILMMANRDRGQKLTIYTIIDSVITFLLLAGERACVAFLCCRVERKDENGITNL